MNQKRKLSALPVLALFLLSGCDERATHGLSADKIALDKRLGELGIGDGFFSKLDPDEGLVGPYSDEDSELVAIALKNNSSLVNLEYSEHLYELAVRSKKGSYVKEALLKESERRLDLSLRHVFDRDIVGGYFDVKDVIKRNRYYENEAGVADIYNYHYNRIKKAREEK